jgi:DNA-binding LacI/PurR family transcriptional regulator
VRSAGFNAASLIVQVGHMTDKPTKKPTSFDVAKLAGVHRSQVSRAFSKNGPIADDTRERVMDAAKQLGYRVNYLARSLQTNSSKLVGIVASRLDTSYRAALVHATTRELQSHGYTPVLVTADRGEDARGLTEKLLNYSVSGMIVTSGTPPSQIIEECTRWRVPVVMVNRDPDLPGADKVLIDLEKAGRLAFDMLHKSGGTRFVVLRPQESTFSVQGRAAAFVAACQSAGVPVEILTDVKQTYDDGVKASDRIAALNGADAVFATTDICAIGLLDGLKHRHGISVPDRIQVVGFDDIAEASRLGNNLSTIRQNFETAAQHAVSLMLQRLEEPEKPAEIKLIELEPVVRGTTRAH